MPATEPAKPSKDLWSLLEAIDISKDNKDDQVQPAEDATAKPIGGISCEGKDTVTLFLGSKSSGKSTLASNIKEKENSKAEEIRPTTIFEYIPIKRKQVGSMRAPVSHIWELATSKCLKDMIRIPITSDRFAYAAFVIVLDLSVPGDVIAYLGNWLLVLQQFFSETIKQKDKNPSDQVLCDKLKAEAMSRFAGGGINHVDKDELVPFPLPVLIVANKYDVFREEDSAKRKVLVQALRYFAHVYGASLMFTSAKDKTLLSQFRSVIKSFILRSNSFLSLSKTSKEFDNQKALFIPNGSDLLDDMGNIPKNIRLIPKQNHEEKIQAWQKIVSESFVPTGTCPSLQSLLGASSSIVGSASGVAGAGGTTSGSSSGDTQQPQETLLPEPTIDRLCQRKRLELQRYRDTKRKTLEKSRK